MYSIYGKLPIYLISFLYNIESREIDLGMNTDIKGSTEMGSSNIPDSINADRMSIVQVHQKLKKGYDDIKNGNVEDPVRAFADFRKKHE